MMADGMYGGFGFVWMLFVGIIVVVPFWKICTRIGYPGWLSLLVLVPIANIVFVYFLAFSEWPSRRPASASDERPEQSKGREPS